MTIYRATEPDCASANVLKRPPHPSLLRVISRKGKHPGRAHRIKRWHRYEVGMSLLYCRETAGLDHLDVLYYEKHGLMTLRDMTPEERQEALRRWDASNPTRKDRERRTSATPAGAVATHAPERRPEPVEPIAVAKSRTPKGSTDRDVNAGTVEGNPPTCAATSNALWGGSRTGRLASARALTSEDRNAVHEALCRGCPEPVWPYGSATSINPLLVVLGASPGNSPQRGDRNFVTREPFLLPTAGEPHPGVFYPDSTGYWDKVRMLARVLLDGDDLLDDAAQALLGTMNLSTAASGRASEVDFEDSFARWVLTTIRDGLRPRVLVLLGLKGRLKPRKALSRLFEDVFGDFDVQRPERRYPLDVAPSYAFREWDLETADGSPLLLVEWPQHPVRPPLKGADMWREACEQFTKRLRDRDPALIK